MGIASILCTNRSGVRFSQQLGQKINKHGDFAGLTPRRRSHSADRNSAGFVIAQDAKHPSGPKIAGKEPMRRLDDAEACENRAAELFAVVAAESR